MRITEKNYKKIPVSEAVEAVPCKNGFYTLSFKKDGKERLAHSKYDPIKESRVQTSDFLACQEKPAVFVFGLGMAYHVYEILNRLPEGGEVYIFEPCPYVCRLYIENCAGALFSDERVKLFSFLDEEEVQADLSCVFSYENCDAFAFFPHPAYAAVFPEEHACLVKAINSAAGGKLAQKNSIRTFGKYWSVNFLKNLKILFESASVKGLFGAFEGRAAIVVSAGPSLTKNVATLQKVGERGAIICTDTAFKALEAVSVTPHLLVTTSGNPWAYKKLLGSGYNDVPLVYKSQSSNDILQNHRGMKFYASHINTFLDETLKELGREIGIIDSGGSVSCSCLDLAVKMGAKTVILLGQDFALTGGEAYAKGVFGAFPQKTLDTYTREAKGVFGDTVRTLQNLDMYRKWFESYISANPDVRFIDATEGGALIEGTEIMDFEQAQAILGESFDIGSAIKEAYLNTRFGEAELKTAILRKYSGAYTDFLAAKEILSSLICGYEAGERPASAQLINALEKVRFYTLPVAYSVLAELCDIRGMSPGKDVEVEIAALKQTLRVLERLTVFFKNAVSMEA